MHVRLSAIECALGGEGGGVGSRWAGEEGDAEAERHGDRAAGCGRQADLVSLP